jgi:hypothetical protein
MKKALLLGFVFSYFIFNAQSFEWAKRAGLWAFDLGYAVATDKYGNVYIAGKYEMNKAVFGSTTVPCAGNHDMYVAKYGPTGDFKWVRTAGGVGGDYAWAMACDPDGNVVVTGEIESTASFGSGVSLKSNGDNDVFVARYNTSGALLWAKKLGGGSKSDKGLGVTISGTSIYVTGKFEGTGNFAGTTLSSAGGKEMFIAKYTTAGAFVWAKKAGGSGDDEGYAICADASGNIYVTGYFSKTANFGGVWLTSKGDKDIYLAKYNSSGSIIWAKRAGGSASDYGMGIRVDNSNRIFLTGGCRLKSVFGTYTITASGGNADIFVAQYDNSGNPKWVKKAGGKYNDYGRALALDAQSNIYITGNYGFNAAFGSYTLNGVDSAEIYFASYDAAGNFRWALKAGGQVDESDPGRFLEMGLSIATDPSGNVLASGAYRSKSTFGAFSLSGWDHTDVYITKIRTSSTSGRMMMAQRPTIIPADSASFCTGGSITLRTRDDSTASFVWFKDGQPVPGARSSSFKTTSAGHYHVGLIVGEDTLTSDTTTVYASRGISPLIRASNPVFCSDSNTLLSAIGGEDYVYQWKRNGRAIRGANSATFQPVRSGNYQVKVVQGSCLGWSETMNVEIKSCARPDSNDKITDAGPPDKFDSLLVSIYPNPNDGKFNIEVNLSALARSSEDVKVEVINAIGQIIYLQMVAHNEGQLQHHVEVDGTAPVGVYFLRVTAGDTVETSRMLLLR